MYSIQRRLMLLLGIGFTALIIVSGIAVLGALNKHVTAEFDATLLAKVRALAALTDQEQGRIEFDYSPGDMPEFENEESPEYFQFWIQDGTVLMRSTHLDQDLPFDASPEENPSVRDVPLPDGRAGRMVQLNYIAKGPQDEGSLIGPRDIDPDEDKVDAADPSIEAPPLALVVARDREPLDLLLSNVRLAIFGVGAVVILLGVVLVWRVLAFGFRPINSIASQVQILDADSLSSRVGLPRTPRELAPIVDQLNGLLKRLDDSFERERRFAGNVAHELRTPIAELRSLAMVGAEWPDDKASVVEFFEDVRGIAGRMEGVIADLLLLARCQAGIEQAVSFPTSLTQVITSAWAKLASNASATGLRFHLDLPRDVVVESDPGKLSIILANILGNAVEYALPKSEIRVVGTRAGFTFQLEITNAANPLSPEDLENLAEPFWRKDESRSSAEHAGLGLSLVSALAMLLHLEVSFGQDPDGTFRVSMRGQAFEASRPIPKPLRNLGS